MTEDTPTHDATTDGGTDSFSMSSLDASDHIDDDRSQHTNKAPSKAKREFLLETVRRAPLLQALQSNPVGASTLSDATDMSRSTVHRATNSLEDAGLITKANGKYKLTNLGKLITDEIDRFGTCAWTAMSLEQFLNAIDGNENGIPINYFANADIIRREPRQPHATIHRIINLFEEADSLRMFSTVISPMYVDVGYREMMNGMEIQAIFDREVIDIMLSEYPEKAHETINTGNFTVYAHDGLPFEMFLFEDKVGLAAHNQNGNAEMLVECTDPSALEWAETIYEKQLANADPLMLPDE